MVHGAITEYEFNRDRRQDCLQFQEKCDRGCCRSRGSRYKDSDHECKSGEEQMSIYTVVSLFDSMVRGVSTRGITRREYSLCLLEKSYALPDKENSSEPTVSVKRKFEDVFCESPRSVLGDQPLTYGNREIKKSRSAAPRGRVYHRQTFANALCGQVFQGLGGDLIAHWLTPVEFYNTKVAFRHDWSWSRAWHGGKVEDTEFASFAACCIHRGASVDAFIEQYGKKKMFKILFYVLPANEYIDYVNKYNYIIGLRKLI